MNRYKKLFVIGIVLFLALVIFHGTTEVAYAQTSDGLTFQGVVNIFTGIACWLLDAFIILFVIAILLSAVYMSISGGAVPLIDGKESGAKSNDKAKKTLSYAIIGALVVISIPLMFGLLLGFINDAGGDAQIIGFSCDTSNPGALGNILNALNIIANTLAVAAVALAVIAIIMGAIGYMLAGGDPKKTEAARKIIINGIIAAIIAFSLAWIIGFTFGLGTLIG